MNLLKSFQSGLIKIFARPTTPQRWCEFTKSKWLGLVSGSTTTTMVMVFVRSIVIFVWSHNLSYVEEHHVITLIWGYMHYFVANPCLHHTILETRGGMCFMTWALLMKSCVVDVSVTVKYWLYESAPNSFLSVSKDRNNTWLSAPFNDNEYLPLMPTRVICSVFNIRLLRALLYSLTMSYCTRVLLASQAVFWTLMGAERARTTSVMRSLVSLSTSHLKNPQEK